MTEADDPVECGRPCPPYSVCEDCDDYWTRMVEEGYWRNGRWTEKGWKEILRHA